MSEASVVVRGLRKVYTPSPRWMKMLVRTNLKHNVVALDNVDFEVGPGEVLAVVGPNGAGKSTAFRILVGLTSPTAGLAEIMGFNCATQSRRVRRLVGWMPAEDRSLLLRLSCKENLKFHATLHAMDRHVVDEKVDRILADVGLSRFADATPFALSAGMRARLQLARALLHEPRVLILDEPTGSVDPVAAHELLELIVHLVEERRIAALISSHRLEEIEALHSHVILLDKGSIRYDGDLDELREIYDLPRFQLMMKDTGSAEAVVTALRGSPGLESVLREGDEVTVVLKRGTHLSTVFNGIGDLVDDVVHMKESGTPLRDILASMYRRTTPVG